MTKNPPGTLSRLEKNHTNKPVVEEPRLFSQPRFLTRNCGQHDIKTRVSGFSEFGSAHRAIKTPTGGDPRRANRSTELPTPADCLQSCRDHPPQHRKRLDTNHAGHRGSLHCFSPSAGGGLEGSDLLQAAFVAAALKGSAEPDLDHLFLLLGPNHFSS